MFRLSFVKSRYHGSAVRGLNRFKSININEPRKQTYSSFSRSSFSSGDATLYSIIGINVAVWSMWKYAETDRRLQKFMLQNFTTSGHDVVKNGRVDTLLWCVFSHKDGWHLFGNCFTLYFFGNSVISVLGPMKFLTFYTAAGVFASTCQVLVPYYRKAIREHSNRNSWTFDAGRRWWGDSDIWTRCLGASGAISGVVMTSIAFFPRQLIYVYGVLPVPAALFGLAYVLKDVLGIVQQDSSSGVGHAAHLGGAAAGLAYGLYQLLRMRRMRWRK
jgi:rhomboid-like protein